MNCCGWEEGLRWEVGGGRCCCRESGDPSGDEYLRERFLVREDNLREDEFVGDGAPTDIGSVISNTEQKRGEVVEKGLLFTGELRLEVFEDSQTVATGDMSTEVDGMSVGELVQKEEDDIDSEVGE